MINMINRCCINKSICVLIVNKLTSVIIFFFKLFFFTKKLWCTQGLHGEPKYFFLFSAKMRLFVNGNMVNNSSFKAPIVHAVLSSYYICVDLYDKTSNYKVTDAI